MMYDALAGDSNAGMLLSRRGKELRWDRDEGSDRTSEEYRASCL